MTADAQTLREIAETADDDLTAAYLWGYHQRDDEVRQLRDALRRILEVEPFTGLANAREIAKRALAASQEQCRAILRAYLDGIGTICGADNREAAFLERIEDMAKAALATPPAPSVPQPGPELDRAMHAALLRSAKIIDVPWQEQAARQCEEWAIVLTAKGYNAAKVFDRIQFNADAVRLRAHARAFRALLSKPAKGEGK